MGTTQKDRLRKLDALIELLSDPAIMQVAQLIIEQPKEGAANAQPFSAHSKPRRKPTKRGALLRATLNVVTNSSTPVTAKDVTVRMEEAGFKFEAADKHIAVSKALRTLWRQNKIQGEKTGRGKAAILYAPPGQARIFPVQETTH